MQYGRVLAAELSLIRNLSIFTDPTRGTCAAPVIYQMLSDDICLAGRRHIICRFLVLNARSPSRNCNANRKGSELFSQYFFMTGSHKEGHNVKVTLHYVLWHSQRVIGRVIIPDSSRFHKLFYENFK